ncbi:MAG TPA: hypothetical protein VK179_19495 [Bacteroidales bacterium]|nr:hypothetical protein [Bacteroidales bacterium]
MAIYDLYSRRVAGLDAKNPEKASVKQFRTWCLKIISAVRIGRISITEARLRQLQSIFTIVTMLMFFLIGYIVLASVDKTLCKWLLSCNLLIVANVILFKMR